MCGNHVNGENLRYFFACLFFVNSLYAGESLSDALKQSSISGYLKSMYVYDNREYPKVDQQTYGFGGKIAAKTGAWYGLSAKIAYYQTADFGLRNKDSKRVDAYMFDVDKSPYSVIGEKYLKYEAADTSIVAGRQEIDTPIISTYDYRIIPNLFEAYILTNKSLNNTSFVAGYVDKMSGLDGLVSFKKFESMSMQTYTSLMTSDYRSVDTSADTIVPSNIAGNQGVVMVGMVYDGRNKFQIWNYYCKDVINEFYADGLYSANTGKNKKVTLEAQMYSVKTIGKFNELIKNMALNGSYELYGAKISFDDNVNGIAPYIAYNRFTGNSKTVTAFGNWGGYPEYVAMPYMFAQDNGASAIANSQMYRLACKIDLAKYGLDGHSFVAGYSLFDLDDSVIKDSDIQMANFLYKAKVGKTIFVKILYENRNSKNYRYANDTLTTAVTYSF